MNFIAVQIGKYTIQKPIIQGGMGVGVSWDRLAGNVSKEGGLGVVSAVGTGYYEDKVHAKRLVAQRPLETENFYSKEGFTAIIHNARKICGDEPLAANILYAINDYGRVVKDACEAGINIIITGAGLIRMLLLYLLSLLLKLWQSSVKDGKKDTIVSLMP